MRREAPVGPSTRAHLLLISLRCQLAVASVQNSPVSVSWEKYVITTPGAAWLSVRFATEGPLGMERSAWGCTAGDWLARYPATPSASCSAIFVRALQAERERKGATRHTGGSPAGLWYRTRQPCKFFAREGALGILAVLATAAPSAPAPDSAAMTALGTKAASSSTQPSVTVAGDHAMSLSDGQSFESLNTGVVIYPGVAGEWTPAEHQHRIRAEDLETISASAARFGQESGNRYTLPLPAPTGPVARALLFPAFASTRTIALPRTPRQATPSPTKRTRVSWCSRPPPTLRHLHLCLLIYLVRSHSNR